MPGGPSLSMLAAAVLVFAFLLAGAPAGATQAPPTAATPESPGEGDPRTLLGLAVAAQQAGELERAVALYERVLAAIGDEPRILSNLGAAYARLGRYPEAVQRYERALALSPSDTPIRQNLALALYKTGELRRAAEEAARIVAAQPGDEAATLLLAECHVRLGENDAAIRLLRREDGRPPEGRAAAYLLGTALLGAGRVGEAQAVLDGVLKDDSAEAHVVLATILLRDGDCGKARPEIRKALEMNPQLPFVNYLNGKCLMADEVSDWKGAAEAFRRELTINPSHFESNLLLGELLRQEGRHEEALPYVEHAARLHGDDLAVQFSQGALYLALGRTSEALPLLEQVAAAVPEHIQAHMQLAVAYHRLGRTADAAREREAVGRLQAQSEARFFSSVSEGLARLIGKKSPEAAPAPSRP
jgi:tetratricopeptide (TPR) repeat protein